MMVYRIRLPNFEGPLDLLLYFIQRDKLNIYDIPIARITRDFLEYVRLMRILNLEIVGEFLVFASMLLQLKAKMLLPKPQRQEESEEEDPRWELVQKLLEYKRFKEAAENLAERYEQSKFIYYRNFPGCLPDHPEEISYKNATLFDLLTALKSVLEKHTSNGELASLTVEIPQASVEQQAEFLLEQIQKFKERSFAELVQGMNRLLIIATFIALLELVKNQLLAVRQKEPFGEILVYEP